MRFSDLYQGEKLSEIKPPLGLRFREYAGVGFLGSVKNVSVRGLVGLSKTNRGVLKSFSPCLFSRSMSDFLPDLRKKKNISQLILEYKEIFLYTFLKCFISCDDFTHFNSLIV